MKEGPEVTPASRLPLPRTDPVTPELRVVDTLLARLVFLVLKYGSVVRTSVHSTAPEAQMSLR